MESKAEPPYVLSEDGDIKLNYKICSHSDPKAMHMFAIDQFLGKPTGNVTSKLWRKIIN